MSTVLLIGIVLFLFSIYFYKWATKFNSFFNDKNVPALKPVFLLGNTGKMIFRQLAPPVLVKNLYNSYPNAPIIGFYDQRIPLYMIRDPELLKILGVKNFDHFLNHRPTIDPDINPLFGKSLFALKGNQWKEMRSTLSPAFTGSRMRSMFELVSKCSDEMAEFCKKNLSNEIIELKDFFSRFSNDVIATCAFGIEVNSLKNKNNSFFKMGEKMMKFDNLKQIIKLIIFTYFPFISKLFKISFFDKEDTQRFHSIILETMNTREKENIIRPDMINLLMMARKGQSLTVTDEKLENKEFSIVEEHLETSIKTHWTDYELTAQCFLFFFAGFDTSSTAMSFMAYELALNPDIQDKLIKEIDSINDELAGKSLTYNKLQEMKYMDMIVSETLRKWPPAPSTDRYCTTELEINYKEHDLKFNVGDIFWIPMYAIHHDPNFYPNPDKFDPERFSDERKHEINPITYIPFGVGPRNCIGSRFALMEIKSAFYSLLKHFKFEICEKTEKFEFGRKTFRMLPDNGIRLRLKPRQK